MSATFGMDLRGLMHKFSNTTRICAVCGKDWDKDESGEVPLYLWRQSDKWMLTLCFPCAEPRMPKQPVVFKPKPDPTDPPPDNFAA